MADSKISALPAVTTPVGTFEIPGNEGGTNKKITLAQINGYTDPVRAAATAAQGPGFAADTYVTGSGITIPQAKMQAGVVYRCIIQVTKTAASTATPAYNLRYGTAGTTADTSRCAFTQTSAQTAAIDTAWIEFLATFRVVGASGVLACGVQLEHDLATTGFASRATYMQHVVSATFDTTPASSKIGVSMNGGTSSAWTVQQVFTELLNLAD